MVSFTEIFRDLVLYRLEQVYQFSQEVGPKIVLALVVLLLGWLCALILKKLVARLLRALGFDVLAEKSGLKRFLEKGGISRQASSAVGLAFYWLIIFSSLIMAFNTLELETAAMLISQVILFLPKIVVGFVLLALGIFLSQFMGKFVEKSGHLVNIPFYGLLARFARYLIIALAIMIALNYLGLDTTIVAEYALIIFGIVPLLTVLVLLIAGREIISGILAGRILIKEYRPGDKIELNPASGAPISGEIEAVDLINTKIRTKQELLFIPNSELAKSIVKKKA